MQPEGYATIPIDLHIPQQGYHPYYRKSQEDSPGPPVVQTRILEMRKEKSRDAARSRRGKENYEFYELAKMLPLPGAITTQLDKASIIRLTISFLKLKDFVSGGDPPWRRDGPSLKGGTLRNRSVMVDMFDQHQATHILQSLDGFAFALGADGRFLYVSETVSIYLGLSQVEMTGSSVFDYIHQQDQSELADMIGINICHSPSATSPASVGSDDGSSSNPGTSTPTGFDRPPPQMSLASQNGTPCLRRSFCIRMKSTLTKRGCHFKSSGYRVVLVLSQLRTQYSFPSSRKTPPTVIGLVAVAIALPPPSVNELRLEQDMFVMRLTFDFRVSHCEPRVADLFDYTAEEITGRNMYSLCHAQDTDKLRKCHTDLIQKGQVLSGYYRLMNKTGGYTWVQSCCTIICNTKNAEEETIICVNYVLSRVEYEHCIMDYSQLPSSLELKQEEPACKERVSSPDKEHSRGAAPSTSLGADQDRAMRLEKEDCQADPNKQFDSATDVDVEENPDAVQPKEDCSPKQGYRDYSTNKELNRMPNNSSTESALDAHIPEGISNSRHRKRKQVESISSSIENESKSPRSRPDSRSSSLEVLSLDNEDYPGVRPIYHQDGEDGLMDQSVTAVCRRQTSNTDDADSPEKNDKNSVSRPWTRSPAPASNTSPFQDGINNKDPSGMSVRELEDAMNRHLPNNGSPGSANSPEILVHKSYQGPHAPSRPIQWIGGAPAPLPATTLLRQIYVSRESVIRSGAHASRHGYGDIQGTLPTPPGGQGDPGYGDTAQLMFQSKLSADAAYGVISGYPPTSNPSGGFVESCNAMTPPSSVSPRDKFNADASAFNEAAAVAAAAAIPHMRHYVTTDSTLQHLPLKPQLFVHPGNLEHAAYGHPQQTLSPDQHQLYHHPSSFHLYHPTPGTSKPTIHATNGSSWFCQPHS